MCRSPPTPRWFVRDSLSPQSGTIFQKKADSACGYFGWCADAASSSEKASIFGNNYNVVDAPDNAGMFYDFFGGRSMSFNRLEMMIKPRSEAKK